MDEGFRKKYPSLPENYVSLAQLKERWLQKQEEDRKKKEQLEKQEELKRLAEVRKRENENDNRSTEKICKDEKNGKKVEAQKMGVKLGGFNADGRMGGMRKERKRDRPKYRERRKSKAAGKKGDVDTERMMTLNEEEKQVLGNNIEKNDLVGMLRNEATRISEGKNSVKEGFTGEEVVNGGREKIEGFSRINWNRKGSRRGIPSDDEIGRVEYKMKEKIVETNGKRGSAELKLEEKGSERIVIRTRFPDERSGRRNGFEGGFSGSVRKGRTSYKLEEKGIEIDDSKESEELTLDKEERERNERGVGFPRNDKNGRIDYEMKRKSIEIGELKVNEELASENKERERNEFLRNGKNGRSDYAIKDHGVEGEEINGNGITPEKVADEVSVGECERNDAKGGGKNGFRRNENRMGKIGREFGNLTLNDNKNWALRVDSYRIAGGRRRYGNRERYGNWDANQRHVWVKKQENSDGNVAQVGFSGMSRDE